MSTNCTIAYYDEKNKRYRTIYSHFDGYYNYTGKILLENYKNLNDVVKLINLGNLSQIKPELDKCLKLKETFNQSEKPNRLYNYLFKDGRWLCFNKIGDYYLKMESLTYESVEWEELSDIFLIKDINKKTKKQNVSSTPPKSTKINQDFGMSF